MVSPPSAPRQMPLNVTTAPVSVRPFVSAAISRAMSKSASWIRIVTGIVMAGLAAGHRRKECDFAGACDRGIRPDVGVVDGRADRPRRLERMGVSLIALRQPAHQLGNGANVCRRLDGFLGQAYALADPGEIFDLHPSSSSM